MKVQLNLSKLKQNKWQEYAVRFGFGGAITALAGFIGDRYGPGVGGLFLAFPAILPASITLIQKHEGKQAAWVDVIGATIGSIGLLVFAIVVWEFAPKIEAWQVLLCATIAWFTVSAGLWWLRQLRKLS